MKFESLTRDGAVVTDDDGTNAVVVKVTKRHGKYGFDMDIRRRETGQVAMLPTKVLDAIFDALENV